MSGATPETRTAVMILVEASWLDQSGSMRTTSARMENYSTGGACIRLKDKIAVGAHVCIRSHREQFSGIIKYCLASGHDFVAGIQRHSVHRPLPAPASPPKVPVNEAPPAAERVAAKAAASRPAPQAKLTLGSPPTPLRRTPNLDAIRAAQLQKQQILRIPEKEPQKQNDARQLYERIFMKNNWFGSNKQDAPATNSNGSIESSSRPAESNPPPQRPSPEKSFADPSDDPASGFQSELWSMDDIYRAAGIVTPRRGYSITKVVDMLRSEHMRGLAKDLRRAAVLMALDAAGVAVDDVLQDARSRQEAIDAYAAEQRKHAEAQWARKAEENIQIQAELEQVKARYAERIRRNLDGVAREKAAFASWLKQKEQETQSMAEAVDQCLKPQPVPDPPVADPLLSVSVSTSNHKPV
jgi:hypothetical protein